MKYINRIILIGILASLFSCSKNFLNTVPEDFVSPSNFLTSDAHAEILLNGIYNSLVFTGPTANENQKMYPYHFATLTDDAFDSQPWHNTTEWARGQGNPNSPWAQNIWNKDYQGIARANVFLDGISRATFQSSNIQRYIAEAKFLRAWFYNDLTTFYGAVPLILKPGDLSNSHPARTPKTEVVAQILKDLNEAIPNLPLTYDNKADIGRVTKGAAMAFKARVLLYNGQWKEAAAEAKAVMDLGIYYLFPNYQGVFMKQNQFNNGIIFQVFHTANIDPSYVYYPFGVYPDFAPTLQFVNSYYMQNGLPITDPHSGYDPNNPFINRDPRLNASIFYPGSQYVNYLIKAPDPSISKDSITIPEWLLAVSGFRVKKIFDGTITDITQEGINTILIRYAEVLLTYAEAENEAVGPTQGVYEAIDQLRERAGMATLTQAMPDLTQDSMRQVIRNERRVELSFEGFRWADIHRWKIGSKVMVNAMGLDNTKLISFPGVGLGTNANWQYKAIIIDYRTYNPNRDDLWPIPQSEMNSNPNMVQNPGY